MDEYVFDANFAAAVVTEACRNRDFFALVGHSLDVAMFAGDDAAEWAVKAAKKIYDDTGRGPGSDDLVFQQLQQWANQGLCPQKILDEVDDLIADGIEAAVPSDQVVAQVIPVVRGFHRNNAVERLIEAHGRREDCVREAEAIKRASVIGSSSIDIGTSFGAEADKSIAQLKALERRPTGIEELDLGLGGGTPNGTLTIWAGSSSAGKSMTLSQRAAVHLMHKLNGLYASLEIPDAYIFARTAAALTGFTIDDFMAQDRRAMEAMENLIPKIGMYRVRYFEPAATTVEDIIAWMELVQDKTGKRVDFVHVDYMDRLGARVPKSKSKGGGSYELGEHVTIALRDKMAVPYNISVDTATQLTRRGAGNKRVIADGEDTSDSLHKFRITDNFFTLNIDHNEAGDEVMKINVSKHRTGKARFVIGPMPTEFAYGRVVASPYLAPSALGGQDDGWDVW